MHTYVHRTTAVLKFAVFLNFSKKKLPEIVRVTLFTFLEESPFDPVQVIYNGDSCTLISFGYLGPDRLSFRVCSASFIMQILPFDDKWD
jgi:hypothetical protein